jgi:hypothetical protein
MNPHTTSRMTPSFDAFLTWAALEENDSEWQKLASAKGLRLPPRDTPCTTAGMERWMHRLGWTGKRFREYCDMSLSEWIERNPHWPLRAFIGLLLEEA